MLLHSFNSYHGAVGGGIYTLTDHTAAFFHYPLLKSTLPWNFHFNFPYFKTLKQSFPCYTVTKLINSRLAFALQADIDTTVKQCGCCEVISVQIQHSHLLNGILFILGPWASVSRDDRRVAWLRQPERGRECSAHGIARLLVRRAS